MFRPGAETAVGAYVTSIGTRGCGQCVGRPRYCHADAGVTQALDLAGVPFEQVRADQWRLRNPCTDWSVRQIVNHLVSGQLFFSRLLSGEPFETALAIRDRDNLGDDPAAAYRASGEALLTAAVAPGRARSLKPPSRRRQHALGAPASQPRGISLVDDFE